MIGYEYFFTALVNSRATLSTDRDTHAAFVYASSLALESESWPIYYHKLHEDNLNVRIEICYFLCVYMLLAQNSAFTAQEISIHVGQSLSLGCISTCMHMYNTTGHIHLVM